MKDVRELAHRAVTYNGNDHAQCGATKTGVHSHRCNMAALWCEAALTAARNAALEDAAKVMCQLCRDDVPLDGGGGQYDGWHMLTELGGASDGGTDYEECKGAPIRALKSQEPDNG